MRDWEDLQLMVSMQDRLRRPELGRRLVSYQEYLDVVCGEEV